MNHIMKAKQELLRACRLTCEKDFTVGTAGNISVRVENEPLFVITPTARLYGGLTEDDLVVMDFACNVIEGKWKPSVEFNLHRDVLVMRKDVNCVCHVHSTYSTAYASIAGITTLPALDVETMGYLGGDLNICGFSAPGTQLLADYVTKGLSYKAGVLMSNHGVTAVGTTVDNAITACEIIEKTCQSMFLISNFGTYKPLDESFVKAGIKKYLAKYGIDESLYHE